MDSLANPPTPLCHGGLGEISFRYGMPPCAVTCFLWSHLFSLWERRSSRDEQTSAKQPWL